MTDMKGAAVATKTDLMRATTSFHAPGNVFVREGDLLDPNDELVKKYRKFFHPATETYRRPIEVRHGAQEADHAEA